MEGKQYLDKAEKFIENYPEIGEAWEEDIEWYGTGNDNFYDALYRAIEDNYGGTIEAGEDQYLSLAEKADEVLEEADGDAETIEYWVAKELFIKEHEIPETGIYDSDVENISDGTYSLREMLNLIDLREDDPYLVNMYDACYLNREQKEILAENIKRKDKKALVENLTKLYRSQNKY